MAIAKVHFNFFKDVELYEVFYDFFSKVSIIEKNVYTQMITFRVEGPGIPDDNNKQVVLELIKFDGIKPFVIGVDIYDYVR